MRFFAVGYGLGNGGWGLGVEAFKSFLGDSNVRSRLKIKSLICRITLRERASSKTSIQKVITTKDAFGVRKYQLRFKP